MHKITGLSGILAALATVAAAAQAETITVHGAAPGDQNNVIIREATLTYQKADLTRPGATDALHMQIRHAVNAVCKYNGMPTYTSDQKVRKCRDKTMQRTLTQLDPQTRAYISDAMTSETATASISAKKTED